MNGPEAVLNDEAQFDAVLAQWVPFSVRATRREAILLLTELRYADPCDTAVLRKVDQFLLQHGHSL